MSNLKNRKERILISFDYALMRLPRNKANCDVPKSELLIIVESGGKRDNKSGAFFSSPGFSGESNPVPVKCRIKNEPGAMN